jgi:hypothetical protein
VKAVRIPVGGTPEVIDMPSTLEGMQAEVGGYIEAVALGPDEIMGWVNEDGQMLGLERNPVATLLAPSGMWLVGPMLVTGRGTGELAGLSEEQAEDVALVATQLKEVVR